MTTQRARFITLLGFALICAVANLAWADGDGQSIFPLAVVGDDTLTTTDLKIELGIMQNQRSGGSQSTLPRADQVLRRLIQNRLVMQEGYRMGLHEEFVVSNQVLEFVRHKTITTLLDSVAGSVPSDTEDVHLARQQAVGNYLADLRRQYHVKVDSTLLASLDYGSAEPEVKSYLRDDTAILAVVPAGNMTVAGFSRILRFTEFHGLVGKPDAAQKRDKVFEEWLAEAVLFHQAKLQNMTQLPQFITLATRMENTLVLQEALRILIVTEFEPTSAEIEDFYNAHLADFTAKPRVRMESLKVASHDKAVELRGRMLDGAPVSWLKKNVDTVVKGPAPFPSELFAPAKLGLKPEEVLIGSVPEPYQVPSGWVVAKVVEVEEPQPTPLSQCQGDVLAKMKTDRTRNLMTDILERLEDATPIKVMPEAEARVSAVMRDFSDRATLETSVSNQTPGQEG